MEDLPEAPTGSASNILIGRAVTATVDRHPAILTSPDHARAALTLQSEFTGTLGELVDITDAITHSAA